MTVSSTSRNTLAPIIEVQDANGNVVVPARVDIRPTINSSKLSDLTQFTQVQGNTWGHIGLDQLGDAKYWWVIADLSEVLDPFTELTPGKVYLSTSQESLFLDILTGA